jgi:hypothetical protein
LNTFLLLNEAAEADPRANNDDACPTKLFFSTFVQKLTTKILVPNRRHVLLQPSAVLQFPITLSDTTTQD